MIDFQTQERKRHLNARNSIALRETKHMCHGSSFWFPAIYCCGLKCCKEDVERVLLNPFSMVSKLRGLFFWRIDDNYKPASATVKCIYLKYIGVIRNLFHGLAEKLKKAANMKS